MSYCFTKLLPKNEKNERPSHVIFLDVESIVHEPVNGHQHFTPFLWTAIYKHYRKNGSRDTVVYMSGTDISDFWDQVESYCYKKTKLYLCTHHLEVDFMPMKGFLELQSRGWLLDKLVSHGRVLTMWWKKDDKKLIILNNGNLFDGSIEQWGQVLGVPKGKMPSKDDDLDKWKAYCMRDTEIIMLMWDNLLNFMDTHDLGNFKLTKAGLALTAFRHRFMSTPIAFHNSPKAIILERRSYKGGRFEALQIGEFKNDTFYSLDINSMYGYIEQTASLPYELRGVKDSMSLSELIKRLDRYAVIADVNITIDKPCLPRIIEGKIRYLPGNFDTVLTTPELIYVLKYGKINLIRTVAWYYKAPILREYAEYFLNLKTVYDKEGNLPMRQVTKLYLNSLYGKFGQHGYIDKIIGDCDPDKFEFVTGYDNSTKERYDIAYYGGKIHLTEETLAGDFTFTAIASHITAYGRMMLYRLIEIAGIENVYHVATDSLVVNEKGFTRLQNEIDPTEPGKLKIERSFTEYTIKDVNDTIQGGKIKIKGISKNAIEVCEDVYQITEWPRLTTLIKQGIYDYYYTKIIKKHLQRKRYHEVTGTPISVYQTDEIGRMR